MAHMAKHDLVASLVPSNLDTYLSGVAARMETHGFLGKATQGVYLSQVEMLVRLSQERFGRVAGVRVLDWGTGKGHISYLLKKAGFDVVSCDVASETIDSSFGQTTPIIADNGIEVVPLEHEYILPFDAAQFDIVVSFGVLEHVPNDRESLRELRRVVSPGGFMFFSFLPYSTSWSQKLAHWRGDFYHSRLYSIRTVEALAKESGFAVDSIWHGQIFPKNSMGYSRAIEKIDRFITSNTPLKYLATNLEGVLIPLSLTDVGER